MSSLEIIYIDSHLIIVNKPAGLLAVPGRGLDKSDCVIARLLQDYKDALVVHRLDQATSGLMVFARTVKAQRELSIAFASSKVSKTYLAVVNSLIPVSAEWHRIDAAIGADWANRPMRKIDPLGKPSTTLWRCIASSGEWLNIELDADFEGDLSLHLEIDPNTVGTTPEIDAKRFSVLLLKPLTGRTHQLRVHLMSSGMPIVGDTLYAPIAPTRRYPRMLLHAYQLSFTHPETKELVGFTLKPDFLAAKLLDQNYS